MTISDFALTTAVTRLRAAGCVFAEEEAAVLSGSAETWYGPGLEERLVAREGDFLYIPAGMPHLARNLSSSEWERALPDRPYEETCPSSQ